MTRAIRGLVLLAAAAAAEQSKPITDQNYRVFHGDSSPGSLDEIIGRARAVSVAFIGEGHDDAVAHYLEAEIFKRLAGPDWALSLEMFERDVQDVMDEYLAGSIDEKDLISSGRAWSNYRTDYKPLVDIAKQNKLPVVAANAPQRYVHLVGRKGQAALLELSPQAKSALPPLPYAPASVSYRKRFEQVMKEEMSPKKGSRSEQDSQHNAADDRTMAAQSLWDAAMADSISRFLNQHPTSHVLQINGAFHSEHHQGILEHLERYRAGTSSIVITIVRDKSFPGWNDAVMKDAGDFVIVTDPKIKPNKSKKR